MEKTLNNPISVMNKIRLSFISLLLIPLWGMAQLPSYQPHDQLYMEATELFEKGIYGQAIKKLDAYLAEEARSGRDDQGNDLRINARFMQAVSAYHLERSNAIKLLDQFAIRYADNSKAVLTRYYLGKYYFEQGDYLEAIQPLLACYTRNALDKERYDEVIFLLGYAYFKENQNDRAVRFFELAADVENEHQEDAQYYYGILLYEDGKYEQAYQVLKQLEDSDTYGQETQVYMANALYELKRYDELFSLSDDMLRDRRKRPDPQVYLIVANASYEQSDYPKALQYFGEYERTKGKTLSRTSNFRYAFSYYKRGEYNRAIPFFEKVVTADDSLQQMASYYLGFCFLETGDPRSARFAFRKAKERILNGNEEVREDALYQYAKVCYTTQEYAEALEALRELERDYPTASYAGEVKSMIGELLLLSEDYAQSIAYLETTGLSSTRAKKAYQTASYYYGLQLFKQEDYRKGMVFLQKAANSSFDQDVSLAAKYWLAESAFRLGDYAQAVSAYQSYRKSPGAQRHVYYAAANYGLGWSYYKQKQYANAIKAFDGFIASGSGSAPERYIVDAYLRAGDSYFLQRNYSRANTYYSRVIENKSLPHRDYAYYQMAEGLYRMGQYNRSVQVFDNMISDFEKSELRDDALDRISEIYATWIKNYDRAALYSRMLVREYPRSPLAAAAYNRLAFTAYNSGDEAGAITYFRKVLTDYTFDKKNAQVALDNLANLLPAAEFDQVLQDYRNKNPELDENLAELAFSTGQARFFEMNYESAIRQFTTYIEDFKNGPNYHEALMYRARAYKELNQLSAALADYQKVYEPTVRNPFTSTALSEAAEIKFEQMDYAASLKLYEDLRLTADAQQNRIQADFGIAKNYKAMGEYRRAITVLEGIVDNSEATLYSVNKAKVEIGICQYLLKDYESALRTFANVEAENKDEFGEQSQYWITQILYDQGQYEQAKDAAIYLKQTYPSNSYWRAKAFLVVAEADYALGNVFQAKGVLESLINEAPFEDIKQMAQERLDAIIAEEQALDGPDNN